MGLQIIKQASGDYCVFSSVVDNITHFNLTKNGVINEFKHQFGIEGEIHAKDVIEKLDQGIKPYYQFTKTYNEMLDWIEEVHGKQEREDIQRLME